MKSHGEAEDLLTFDGSDFWEPAPRGDAERVVLWRIAAGGDNSRPAGRQAGGRVQQRGGGLNGV